MVQEIYEGGVIFLLNLGVEQTNQDSQAPPGEDSLQPAQLEDSLWFSRDLQK